MSQLSFPITILIFTMVVLIGVVGIAGWYANGGGIFMVLAQTGLAWCL